MKRILIAMIAGLSSSVTLAAELEMPTRYDWVGGHLGQHVWDFNSRGQDRLSDTTLAGLQLGRRFSPSWSVQAWWERNNARWRETGRSANLSNILLSGRYHFVDTSLLGFEPYAGLGFGETRVSVNDSEHEETVLAPEFGLQRRLRPHWVLDLGLRPLYSIDNERWDAEAYVGLNLLFGIKDNERKPAQQAKQTAEVREESPPAETIIVIAPGDLDGDGAPDNLDQCPNTPAGIAVDARGCPQDSDADGIPDHQDSCANTPARAKVDSSGCQEVLSSDIRETLYIEFDTGRATVHDSSMSHINRVATLMYEYPSASLLVEGHTDSSGSRELNDRLSQQRAEAVKQVLVVRHDIDAARIETIGYGPAKPIADNASADGRKQNRRVEIILRAQIKQPQYQ